MSDGAPPPMRASDDDRHRVAAALSDAFARGQLDYGEFDERTKRVWVAKHHDELLDPLIDLMPDPARVLAAPPPAVRPERTPEPGRYPPDTGTDTASRQVTGEPGGQSFTLALMGGSGKRGDWLCAPHHVSIAVMGGTDLDLRRARFHAHETTITAVALMGGTDIIVPHDVRVINDGVGVMGAFDIEEDEDVLDSMEELPTNAPVIRINGLGLMGAVTMRRARRESTD
ncbi:DUF1707 SHOCT-like domain-containing protein [Corynebacterium halotolerans]|nr:DUF1707 domain-containing protein [Corynebacterium halotolerans]